MQIDRTDLLRTVHTITCDLVVALLCHHHDHCRGLPIRHVVIQVVKQANIVLNIDNKRTHTLNILYVTTALQLTLRMASPTLLSHSRRSSSDFAESTKARCESLGPVNLQHHRRSLVLETGITKAPRNGSEDKNCQDPLCSRAQTKTLSNNTHNLGSSTLHDDDEGAVAEDREE